MLAGGDGSSGLPAHGASSPGNAPGSGGRELSAASRGGDSLIVAPRVSCQRVWTSRFPLTRPQEPPPCAARGGAFLYAARRGTNLAACTAPGRPPGSPPPPLCGVRRGFPYAFVPLSGAGGSGSPGSEPRASPGFMAFTKGPRHRPDGVRGGHGPRGRAAGPHLLREGSAAVCLDTRGHRRPRRASTTAAVPASVAAPGGAPARPGLSPVTDLQPALSRQCQDGQPPETDPPGCG